MIWKTTDEDSIKITNLLVKNSSLFFTLENRRMISLFAILKNKFQNQLKIRRELEKHFHLRQ